MTANPAAAASAPTPDDLMQRGFTPEEFEVAKEKTLQEGLLLGAQQGQTRATKTAATRVTTVTEQEALREDDDDQDDNSDDDNDRKPPARPTSIRKRQVSFTNSQPTVGADQNADDMASVVDDTTQRGAPAPADQQQKRRRSSGGSGSGGGGSGDFSSSDDDDDDSGDDDNADLARFRAAKRRRMRTLRKGDVADRSRVMAEMAVETVFLEQQKRISDSRRKSATSHWTDAHRRLVSMLSLPDSGALDRKSVV